MLLIKNGTIVNPAEKQHEVGDILVENGKIQKIAKEIPVPESDVEVFDAKGLVVTPGLIDMHVHLREPGQEAKEDIHTGTEAAAAGGITRVATMANTKPVIDNSAVLRDVQKRAEDVGVVKVSVIGSISKIWKGSSSLKWGIWQPTGLWLSPMTAIMWKMPISCAGPWSMQICSINGD